MPGKDREFTMRFLAGAADRNLYGTVHGGAMMKWMDEAAYACAAGWCGIPCVTVSVSGITFHKPVPVGHVVELRARLVYTGRTSMHVAVRVCSRDPMAGEYEQTTSCLMVFVAIDADGRPTPIPKWEPSTPEDLALQARTLRLMALGHEIQGELQAFGQAQAQADSTTK
jgi:acyl-CoA hydrolase